MSRNTRSASAASGTFSTKLVEILSPNSFSIALRPLSCAKVQPPSPTGPTYANAIFSGAGFAGAAADAGAAACGGGSSFLPQPTKAATAATAERLPSLSSNDRWVWLVMGSPVGEEKNYAEGTWRVIH